MYVTTISVSHISFLTMVESLNVLLRPTVAVNSTVAVSPIRMLTVTVIATEAL